MKMRTQMLFGFALVFVLMIFISGTMYQSTNSLLETKEWIEHTHEVIAEATLLQKLLVDMETGLRGFVITGEEEFLEPYDTGKLAYNTTLASLRDLVSDNAPQLQRLNEINPLVETWHTVAAVPKIEARRQSAETASGLALARTGKTIMDTLRGKIRRFIDVENKLRVEREKDAVTEASQSVLTVILGTAFAVVFGMMIMLYISGRIQNQVGGEPAIIAGITQEIAQGNLDLQVDADLGKSTGIMNSVLTMMESLRESRDEAQQQHWLETGIARLNEVMSGDPDLTTLSSKVISEISTYLDAHVGAFYSMQDGDEPTLSLSGSYAYIKRKSLSNRYKLGEGLVGQAALEKQRILVKNVPEDYIKVTSGLGESTPRFLCVSPFVYEDRVKGVIEVGTLNEMTEQQLEYLERATFAVAVVSESVGARAHLTRSLQESQRLTAALQTQQEELRATNEELEEKTQRLEESEAKLQAQQEELQVINEELEEKNWRLDRSKRKIERASEDIEKKAEELALASKYKSEFLANMSHELRTPLNSLLLLARGLLDNKEGNLTEDQVESAGIIYGAGNDLLSLINEILDLSKIEAGRMDLHLAAVTTSDLAEGIQASFGHLIEDKGLTLNIAVDRDAPAQLMTDQKRLEQILKNLISNAIKFTGKGGLEVTFGRPGTEVDLSRSGLVPESALAIAVMDTGIGIAPDKQKIIFEAFQQADGGTSRSYGGTGLGLSISRELTRLLGGEIHLESESGKGSTFTLYLPIELAPPGVKRPEHARRKIAQPSPSRAPRAPSAVPRPIDDDRNNLGESDPVILVIEDDAHFARILCKTCREKGFKCLAAATGEDGLALATHHRPSAVLLDIELPGVDGWAVLSLLKDDPGTRHIPVHIISAEQATIEARRNGAIGHLTKPVDREGLDRVFGRIAEVTDKDVKNVLVVEDDDAVRKAIVTLLGNEDIHVDEAMNGKAALDAIRSRTYDCVILDLGLEDVTGDELLRTLDEDLGTELPPVIINTARDLTREEEMRLREYAESIVVKNVRSNERLLDDVSLFLHRVVSEIPEKRQRIITDLRETEAMLANKKILIVDDDMRSTFALSRLLTERGARTLKAEDGRKALQLLEREPDVELVLTDIMMPVMDGYETIRRIRAQDRFSKLPIIALTAKAMKEDREKCIAAGANDYLPKPVDPDRVLSMVRVWLYR